MGKRRHLHAVDVDVVLEVPELARVDGAGEVLGRDEALSVVEHLTREREVGEEFE